MTLGRYLERIGYTGPRAPSQAVLQAVHRAHLLAIPYENLDIHLGRRLTLDPARFFTKLVLERRGGWCYEMNGLLAWALRELGFQVDLLAGAVGRDRIGDDATGNHLVLLVRLPEPWVADVGFGDGFLEPLPLVPGTYRQGFLEFRLEQQGERWVVHNHRHGAAPQYDFTIAPTTLGALAQKCHELQTAPTSGFVRQTVCQRHTRRGIVTLRGALLRRVTARGVSERVLRDARDFSSTLRRVFDLRLPGSAGLWRQVWARHDARGAGPGMTGSGAER